MNNKRLACLLTLFVVCVVTMAVDNTIYNVRETPKSGFFPLSKSAIYTDAADYKVVGIAAGMLADDIERINRKFLADGTNYVLIGPGRWGSSDQYLGVPVKWPHISAARVIVEVALKNYRVDPSQGTHFFQNITITHSRASHIEAELATGYL